MPFKPIMHHDCLLILHEFRVNVCKTFAVAGENVSKILICTIFEGKHELI